jgi:hypothetical protein
MDPFKFKSPLRLRIKKTISELIDQKAECIAKRNGKHHRSEEISKLILEESRIDVQIKCLRELIK